eukprot:TRINITY_DN113097_c0_g1_i1.p1 TRINITY_DN113097_c0_g1~~TRINITY_DN113097_c0_g1_i1.p1  ORF type:complete len:341 (+),score=41.00 TRINITY_DN113097_c0_g1_i1:43-1065(+)
MFSEVAFSVKMVVAVVSALVLVFMFDQTSRSPPTSTLLETDPDTHKPTGQHITMNLPTNQPLDMSHCGVLFVATANTHFEGALALATSFRRRAPELAIGLWTSKQYLRAAEQRQYNQPLLDHVMALPATVVDSLNENRTFSAKLYGIAHSPFDCTLFMDTNMAACGNITKVLEVLTRADIAMVPRQNSPNAEQYEINMVQKGERITPAFPPLDGGFLVYRRNSRTIDILNQWADRYSKHQPVVQDVDQRIIHSLLWEFMVNTSVVLLPPELGSRLPQDDPHLDCTHTNSWDLEDFELAIEHDQEILDLQQQLTETKQEIARILKLHGGKSEVLERLQRTE